MATDYAALGYHEGVWQMGNRDYAVAPSILEPGVMMLHRADCPAVRAQAEYGEPVLTLLGCAVEPSTALSFAYLARHSCLEDHPGEPSTAAPGP